MARNGSGTYVLPAGQPVVTGTIISSTVFNTLTTDIGNALTTSICTDGQTPMAANLSMGSNKITNLALATASTDAVRLGQVITQARYGTMQLRGLPTPATPLTKYDLSVLYVELSDSSFKSTMFGNPGTITCDLGLAGSVINGRDQAAVFPAGNWIHIYYISNGTTLATIASINNFAPTMPSGYTYWCLATILYWNGSSQITPCYTQGNEVYWSPNRNVLASGSATVETLVTTIATVPPLALSFFGTVQNVCTSGGGGAGSNSVRLRAISGSTFLSLDAQAPSASVTSINSSYFNCHNRNNTLYYLNVTGGSITSVGATIDMLGFKIPNNGG